MGGRAADHAGAAGGGVASGTAIDRSRVGRPAAGEVERSRRGGKLFAALRGTCLDGAVLRAGGISQRASFRVVAHAGAVSVAGRIGERAGAVQGCDYRASCTWCRVLWA